MKYLVLLFLLGAQSSFAGSLGDVCRDAYEYSGIEHLCIQKVQNIQYSEERADIIFTCQNSSDWEGDTITCLSQGLIHNKGLTSDKIELCTEMFTMSDSVKSCIRLANSKDLTIQDMDKCSKKIFDGKIFRCLRKKIARNRR